MQNIQSRVKREIISVEFRNRYLRSGEKCKQKMPTLQTKTSADSTAAQKQQDMHIVLSHSSNNINQETTSSDNGKMPTVLRDVDELVNDIKWNLKLRGTTVNATEGNVNNGLLRCCFNVEANTTERKLIAGVAKRSPIKTTTTSHLKLARIKTSPYYVVDKTTTCCNNNHLCTKDGEADVEIHRKTCQLVHHRRHRIQQKKTSDDPYELLQELLKEGGLIKEAVRRLNYIDDDDDETNNKCFDYDQDDYEPSSAVVV